MDIMNSFSSRLKSLRESNNLSQSELGDLLGVSRGSISFYEKAERVPDIEFLVKTANYFDVSLDYLVGKTDAKTCDKDIQFICDYTGLNESAVEWLHQYAHFLSVEREDLALTDDQYEKEISRIEYVLNFYNSMIASCNGIESTNSLGDYLFSTKKLIDELKAIISDETLDGVNRCAVTEYTIEKEQMNYVLYYQALDYLKKAVDNFCSTTVEELKELKETAKSISKEYINNCKSTKDFLKSKKKYPIKSLN